MWKPIRKLQTNDIFYLDPYPYRMQAIFLARFSRNDVRSSSFEAKMDEKFFNKCLPIDKSHAVVLPNSSEIDAVFLKLWRGNGEGKGFFSCITLSFTLPAPPPSPLLKNMATVYKSQAIVHYIDRYMVSLYWPSILT